MATTPSKSPVPTPVRSGPVGPAGERGRETPDGRACADVFAEALAGLQPMELRVVHLAMSRAAALEAAGRGAEADTLLLGVLRTLNDDRPIGARRAVRGRRIS